MKKIQGLLAPHRATLDRSRKKNPRHIVLNEVLNIIIIDVSNHDLNLLPSEISSTGS